MRDCYEAGRVINGSLCINQCPSAYFALDVQNTIEVATYCFSSCPQQLGFVLNNGQCTPCQPAQLSDGTACLSSCSQKPFMSVPGGNG